jgi:hypothetical protein
MSGANAFSDDGWAGAVDPKNFSATLTFATDYLFRGVSQTDNKARRSGQFRLQASDRRLPRHLGLECWTTIFPRVMSNWTFTAAMEGSCSPT